MEAVRCRASAARETFANEASWCDELYQVNKTSFPKLSVAKLSPTLAPNIMTSEESIASTSRRTVLERIQISSTDDVRIAHFTNLRDPTLRLAEHSGKTSRFIAEGETVSRHLLESKMYEVESILITPHHMAKMSDALEDLEKRTDLPDRPVPLYICPADLLEKLSGFNFHRGVLASAPVPPPKPLPEILATSRVLVILEHVVSMDNVGSIFRNLACFVPVEEAAVLLTPGSCHPLYRKAIRVSVGHALRVKFGTLNNWPTVWGKRPVVKGGKKSNGTGAADEEDGELSFSARDPSLRGQYGADPALYAASPLYFKGLGKGDDAKLHPNIVSKDSHEQVDGTADNGPGLDDDLAMITAAGFQTIAMTPHPSALDIRDFSKTLKEQGKPKIAVILGAEGPGLQQPTLERVDHRVKIPMSEGSDSLNVATSLAVALSWLV